ncbi:MAG: DUF1624 domain-containing protein [Anaerolineaceae bacterium]|nr:DUF1624 domain-containing protein [Anaerolineaceae bacterium]
MSASSVIFQANVSTVQSKTNSRFVVLDMLRGIAMLLMALDHAAYFSRSGIAAESYDCIKPELESWPHILSGILTNIATPIFYVLAGSSVAFFEASRRNRGWTEWQITRFLLVRAVVLFLLDALLVVGVYQSPPTLSVLSAVGVALVMLAFLRRLPVWVVTLVGFILIVVVFPTGLYLMAGIVQEMGLAEFSTQYPLLKLLFLQNTSVFPPVQYPILGWPPLGLVGYVFGRLLINRKITLSFKIGWLGVAGLGIWFILRLVRGYGNFLPYQSDWEPVYFIIQNKQPPSLVYILFYLSLALLILAALLRFQRLILPTVIGHILTVFGQTALFFYAAHLLIYGLIIPRILPSQTVFVGRGLIRCYLAFVLGILILYPLCIGYRKLKRTHPNSVLRFL